MAEKITQGEDIIMACIGASADGITAMELFFKNFPSPGSKIIMVVVQHLSPDHKSILPEILQRNSQLRVFKIKNNMMPAPGNVYVLPAGYDASISGGKFRLVKYTRTHEGLHLPIDKFFRSLAAEYGSRSAAIVISGTGSDGCLGIKNIKDAGGLVMAQDPKTAKFRAMPQNAIDTGLVEKVASPEDLPALLLEFQRNCTIEDQPIEDPNSDELMERMFQLILIRTGHDFSGYKKSMIHRRIRRRMTLHREDSFQGYIALLEKSPSEVENLFRDLLIGVTSFFRDMGSFEALQEKVLSTLIKKGNNETIRIWIAACSSGEEVYSTAILASEIEEKQGIRANIRIFASDIDQKALEVARQGRYKQNIVADIPEDLLKKYFSRKDDMYHVNRELRNMVAFAEHNILKDPPYSQLDLIICRNFLIYLESDTQQHVLNTFHYALKDDGYLFMGKSENHSAKDEYFKFIENGSSLFKKRQNNKARENYMSQSQIKDFQRGVLKTAKQSGKPISVGEFAEKTAIRNFMHPFLVIDRKGEIQYSLGQSEKYLAYPTGEPVRNIVTLAIEGLKLPISRALRKIRTKSEPVRLRNIKVILEEEVNGIVNLSLIPVTRPVHLNHLVIVNIEPVHIAPGMKGKGNGETSDVSEESNDYIRQLEMDLQENREYLGNVIEELETANNETISTNEELQGTVEELETSKEEMQSLNEELETSNNELRSKIDEITLIYNDLETLFRSTTLGILYLDSNLRIRKFSPQMKEMVNLFESDTGRSIEDFEIRFRQGDLISDVRNVIQYQTPIEKDVTTDNKNFYWMRILPYRIIDNRVDGVVITFTNITERYRIQKLVQESEQWKKYKHLFHHIEHGFALFKAEYQPGGKINDLKLVEANVTYEEIMHVNLEKDRNRKMSELFNETGIPFTMQQICRSLQAGKAFNEDIHLSETDRFLKILCFSFDTDLVATFVQDVTADRREIKARLHLASIVESNDDAIFSESCDGKILTWNRGAAKLYGYTEEEALSSGAAMLYIKSDTELDMIGKVKKGENIKNFETIHNRKDGSVIHVSVTRSPIRNESKEIVAISTIVKDITLIKNREKELITSREIAEQAVKIKNLFLSNISHEVRTPLNAILGFANMLNDEVSNARGKRYIGIIADAGQQLLHIITDIIDVSRLEAGELPLQPTAVDIDQLMRETWEQFEGYVATNKKQQIDFRLKLPEHEGILYAITDMQRLKQVIRNLVSNALKFTEKGYVEFGYSEVDDELLFYVSDSGVGISKKDQERIFGRFQQVGEAVQGKVIEGTGLGLTISRGIILQLGGRIWVESDKGKGSVFYFTIPMKHTEDTKETGQLTENSNPPDLSGKRILIGEDDPYSLETLKYILKDTGAKITSAGDGESLLEMFHSQGADLILLDIKMPKKNGYEVVRELRSANIDIPVIAVSAFAMPEQLEKSMDSGFDDHLVKPVSKKLLFEALVKHLK